MGSVLCLTGMHRSGTSLTASWLERCGLAIHAGRMYEASEGNARGHFEDVAMVDFQGAVLRSRGLGSVGWGLRGDRFLRFDPAERAQAEALVAERDRRFPRWGWKDPRSVLFLEQWQELAPGMKVLLLWRPASDVVDSLVRRSRRSDNPDMRARSVASIRLWKAYNRLVLAYRSRNPDTTVLLPLARLLAADRPAFDLLERRLGMGLEYTPLTELFDPALLHTTRSARHEALGVAAGLAGCAALERELLAASDQP